MGSWMKRILSNFPLRPHPPPTHLVRFRGPHFCASTSASLLSRRKAFIIQFHLPPSSLSVRLSSSLFSSLILFVILSSSSLVKSAIIIVLAVLLLFCFFVFLVALLINLLEVRSGNRVDLRFHSMLMTFARIIVSLRAFR